MKFRFASTFIIFLTELTGAIAGSTVTAFFLLIVSLGVVLCLMVVYKKRKQSISSKFVTCSLYNCIFMGAMHGNQEPACLFFELMIYSRCLLIRL